MNRITPCICALFIAASSTLLAQAWQVDSLIDPMTDVRQFWASLRAAQTTSPDIAVEIVLWCRPGNTSQVYELGIWSTYRPEGIWDEPPSVDLSPPEPNLLIRFDSLPPISMVARGRSGSARGYILTPLVADTGSFKFTSKRADLAREQVITALLAAQKRLLVQFKLVTHQDLTALFALRPAATREALRKASAPCGGLGTR